MRGGGWRWQGGEEWGEGVAPPANPNHCLLLREGGGWGGAPCSEVHPGVCEAAVQVEVQVEVVTGKKIKSRTSLV